MLRITQWLCVGTFLWDFVFCSIKCPDWTSCSDSATCCPTAHGYGCCPYTKGVCCAGLAHCCPSGFHCNLAAKTCMKSQPWMNISVGKEAGETRHTSKQSLISSEGVKNHLPDHIGSVYCDQKTVCPERTKCCRHPKGAWFCCLYYPGNCCLDGYHCCPYGYDCDFTYTHCIREGLKYPFSYKPALSVPASLLLVSENKGKITATQMAMLTDTSGNLVE